MRIFKSWLEHCIYRIKYYLNGVMLVTMKELNGTKDVLKYGPVGTCALISNLWVCAHMLQSGHGIGKWAWSQTY